jgi:hypothetical protein
MEMAKKVVVTKDYSELGVNQKDILRSLIQQREWRLGVGWHWKSPAFTLRVIESLAKYAQIERIPVKIHGRDTLIAGRVIEKGKGHYAFVRHPDEKREKLAESSSKTAIADKAEELLAQRKPASRPETVAVRVPTSGVEAKADGRTATCRAEAIGHLKQTLSLIVEMERNTPSMNGDAFTHTIEAIRLLQNQTLA